MVQRIVEPFLSLFRKIPLQFWWVRLYSHVCLTCSIRSGTICPSIFGAVHMTKGFYQHYSPEDYVFIDRVLELVARVEQQYSFELTFLFKSTSG